MMDRHFNKLMFLPKKKKCKMLQAESGLGTEAVCENEYNQEYVPVS